MTSHRFVSAFAAFLALSSCTASPERAGGPRTRETLSEGGNQKRSLPPESKGVPNFILIFADDLGYGDLGCYNPSSTIRTPRLDRMAAEGVRFTDFYSAAPVCTPSRAALMTGCYPIRVGMSDMPRLVLFPDSKEGLHPDEVTIAEILKARGYATACVGKWHLGHLPPFLPTRQGFDSYFGIPYSNDMKPTPLMRNEATIEEPADQATLTERYTDEAVAFIRANRGRPFFLYLPHTFPHVPLYASDRFRGKSPRGLYGDVVEAIDWSTGRILDTLAELGIDDRTLVLFTSDNGPWVVKGEHGGSAGPLRGAKGTTFEGGMREPCIARWPARIPAGSVCREVATAMDVMPTFARLAGAAPLADRIIDGKDITPLLEGRPGAVSPHEAFFYYRRGALEAVRGGRWKLMCERRTRQEYPYGEKKPEDVVVPEALFDLESDLGETTNVIDKHPGEAARLRALANAMRDDVGDARTEAAGRNRRPAGRIND
jgi:arylsulfatase A-like enzyme